MKSCTELGIGDPSFTQVILQGMFNHFEELSIPWAVILLKHLAQLPCEDRTLVLEHLILFSGELHNMLRKAYETKSAAQAIMSKDGSFFESEQQMYERVPDLGDYQELWLFLQLFAAVRTQVI